MHRSITGDIRTLSVKRDRVGDWFITVTAESLKEESTSPDTVSEQHTEPMRPIGTDLGLKSIITTSDDIHIEPPKYLRRMEKKLKKAQRQLSKKKKGSVKWNKARKKVAKINRKIERQRDDFSHKTSNNLVRDHDLIVFEDLNITGMVLCIFEFLFLSSKVLWRFNMYIITCCYDGFQSQICANGSHRFSMLF